MTPNFVVVVNVLLPICCHIWSCLPYLHIFVEEMAALLGALTDKWVWKLFCRQNSKISNGQVKFAAKIMKANFIACELLVKRVVTYGVALCLNQWPINFILHFIESRLVVLSNTKVTLFGNEFFNSIAVIITLISFRCFWVNSMIQR